MTSISSLEYEFDTLWEYLYPDVDLVAEYIPIPGRRFKFDYCHLSSFVLIECQGQIWHKGGHNTGKGLMRDYEKLNLAQAHGFCVFQLSPEMVTEDWLHLIAWTINERKSAKC